MPEASQTVLEISLSNLKHNYNFLRSRIDDSTKFLGVVKAFAYGSDVVRVGQCLEECGADYLAVAYTREGVLLRDAGVRLPILVLHPQIANFKTIIDRCLEPNLYSPKTLNAFMEKAKDLDQKDYPVHIKFNTGLNRLGFWENDVEYILARLKSTQSVKVKSIFSHMAASEDMNEAEFTEAQVSSFIKSSDEFIEGLGYRPMLHMCNTSGLFNYPDAHFDMVRSGIGLYGFGNAPEYREYLKPIGRLKSVISQIHLIEEGETVGYNRAFKAEGFKKTATIPIGHADGIGRQFGHGKGFVFVNDEKALIIGNVCMDMIMIDITDIECKEGDEVIIFDEEHSAEDLATSAQTISYELITAISQRVPRHYTEN